MAKLTRWERSMQQAGFQVIQFTHEEIVDHLLEVFNRDRADLLAKAAADDTRRHELVFILDYDNIDDMNTIFGGTVVYNKKLRRFTHIAYSDRNNWEVRFSIETRVAYFAHEFWKPLIKIQQYWSLKKLTAYLLNN